MLAQTVITLVVMGLFALWLLASRMQVAAEPYAQLWAAPLMSAASHLTGGDVPLASPGYPIQRRVDRPALLTHNIAWGPGAGSWIRAMQARGLEVDEFRVGQDAGGLRVWLHVVSPGPGSVWLGVPAPPIWPGWNGWNITLTSLMLALVGGMSWAFARRVTRPLERLRQRMAGGAAAHVPSHSPGDAYAPAEVVAIADDYNKLVGRLSRSEHERALLLAGVSHDLRSPLGRIRLAAEMLPATPETQADLAIITRNVDHADRLIGSFLDFVRAGAMPMNETVDVAAVAQAVVSRFERAPWELRLELQAAEPALLHRANGLLLDRLIFNLVDNAFKHGRAPVSVRLGHDGRALVLDVCDLGAGLPGGAGAMLEAFARGDASRGVPGSGLGLPVVQQVVVRLGGTLQFTHDDAGHRVRVTLP